jgi:branched-chain amino acid transport system substrate-binding protein
MRKIVPMLFLTVMLLQGALLAQTQSLVIPVILSLSGPAAATGATEEQALQIYEKVVNATGGIRGRPVQFDIHDDQTNPQTALQLTNEILASHPSVILGSILTATCASMATVLMKNGPLHYCFSPGVTTEPGGYVFAASSSFQANSLGDLNYVRRRGFTRIAYIASTDASGQESQRLTNANVQLPAYKNIKLVDAENFAPSDISVTAQIARIKSADPDFVFVFAIGGALATVLRALHDGGMNVPVLTNAVNMNVAQLRQYASFLPKELLFLGFPYQGTQVPNPQIRSAAKEFFDAYKAAGITSPSPMAVYAWDPARLVVYTLRALGADASPAQLRDYLAHLHGVAGLNGVYDFRPGDQHGVGSGSSALTIVRWDPAALTWVPAP